MITSEEALGAFKIRLTALVARKKKAQKTQKQISAGIGISEQALSMYLGDDARLPRADMLLRMAAYFRVSVDYLLGRAEGKTRGKDQVHKLLGLSNGAIEKLYKVHHCAEPSLPESEYPTIISALLETQEGREVLNSITRYAIADLSEATGFDIENLKDIGGSFSHLRFRAVQAAGSEKSKFFTSVEDLAVVFISDITGMLKGFRRVIQSGEYDAPYHTQDQPNSDPRAGFDQAGKELKARLLQKVVYSTVKDSVVRKKGKHVSSKHINSKYQKKAAGLYIPSLTAELTQTLEEHRNRVYAKLLLERAEKEEEHVDSADSE